MKAKAFDSKLFRRILTYTTPYKLLYRGVVATAILLSIVTALRPFLLKKTVDVYIEPKDSYGLLWYVILMGIVLILEGVFQFFFVYWANLLGQNIIRDIRQQLFSHLLRFRMKYFDIAPVGQLVTRTVSDIEQIARIFSQGLFMIISDLLKMVVVLGFMFYMNWRLTLIVVAAMPLLVYVTRIFQRKMQVAFEEVRHQVAAMNTFVQERVTGMKIVQLFNRETIEYQKFKEINQKHNKAWMKTILYNSIFFPIADIISSLCLALVVLYGGFHILDGDKFTTFGDLISYTMFIGMLFNPLRQIADKFNEMQMGMIAGNRVFDVLDAQDDKQEGGTIEAPQFKGKIELQKVRFSYVPGEEVLKGISIGIQPGQTVAIVGATGAGKSTIINLLNRFYEIDSGTITIDDTPIHAFTLPSLRRQIAVVLQDVFLFADTIYNNITLGNPNITRKEVEAAAARIGIADFIESLPGGYDHDVKERGVMLSSGQRQLIAFLRAYLSNPSILILDEATSSIDTHAEELIQHATETITKGRTAIVIAHRLATIVNADTIIVMEKGEIVETGNHQELLQLEKGYYRKLYESQFSESSIQ
ncbi:ABC transporter ATP-binding protein [Flavobacterium sp.]|jgi:ATP-binding cassette subfamily B multidrug efflux pump|uniref:ABC transporter ATP-binding protein n=1 Tax=Flavobacterium sp. TaxID=239 RepID=UPI0022C95BEA|nr:ABC transporter ATP-binding protein [Flavobacterium sp.]MCZ8167645.1 ABC transporter ATP-binding protein [Flavobacterium sp.]MCZ8295720.1 ABC transporter ATP-binding protein [Flavobacterium sp.]